MFLTAEGGFEVQLDPIFVCGGGSAVLMGPGSDGNRNVVAGRVGLSDHELDVFDACGLIYITRPHVPFFAIGGRGVDVVGAVVGCSPGRECVSLERHDWRQWQRR